LAGAASARLMEGVVHLRPEGAMAGAMRRGWRGRRAGRGPGAKAIGARERLVRRFLAVTSGFPWRWGAGRVGGWTLAPAAGHHLAAATVRGCQAGLRLFGGCLTGARYGWAAACGGGVRDLPGAGLR
jgi:hypothetical protein